MITLLIVYVLSVALAGFMFAGLLEWFSYLSSRSEKDALSWYGRATYYLLGLLLGPALDALLNKKQFELRVFISASLFVATLLTVFFTGECWASVALFLISMLVIWLSIPINRSTK